MAHFKKLHSVFDALHFPNNICSGQCSCWITPGHFLGAPSQQCALASSSQHLRLCFDQLLWSYQSHPVPTHTEPPYREFTFQGWHLTCAGEEGESKSPAPRSCCIWTSCQSSTERPGRRHPFQNVPYMAPFPVLPPPSQALAFSRHTSLINLLTQILGMGPDSEELDLRQYKPPSLQKEKCSPLYTQNYLSILS